MLHVSGSFICTGKKNLTSLYGSPKTVGGNFECNMTGITSLRHAPETVLGSFNASHCLKLISLHGSQKKVRNSFYCEGTAIRTLLGSPESVGGEFNCSDTVIKTLQGAPAELGGRLWCFVNHMSSIAGAPKDANITTTYRRELGLLGITEYSGSIIIRNAPRPIVEIKRRYQGGGNKAVIAMASELIMAGFPGNAKL